MSQSYQEKVLGVELIEKVLRDLDGILSERMERAVHEVCELWNSQRGKPKNKRSHNLNSLCEEAVRKHFPEYVMRTKKGRELVSPEFRKRRDKIHARVVKEMQQRTR